MHKPEIPLRAKARPTGSRILGDPFVVLQVFGDGNFPGLAAANFVVDPLHEAPAIWKVTGWIIVAAIAVADIDHRIEAKAIYPVLLKPE